MLQQSDSFAERAEEASAGLPWLIRARAGGIVRAMSFQAYLDNIEAKTGKTPAQFVAMAAWVRATPVRWTT